MTSTVFHLLRSSLPCRASLLQCRLSPSFVIPERGYRGRKTHLIGRSHGLVGSKIVRQPLKKDPLRDEVNNLMEGSGLESYQDLDLKITGYDMVLVEQFAKYAHRLLIKHRQEISEAFALPTYDTVIKQAGRTLAPKVEDMETDFVLSTHTRMIRILNVPSHMSSILLQALMDNVPQSVSFTVQENSEEDDKKRFKRRTTVEAAEKVLRELIKSR